MNRLVAAALAVALGLTLLGCGLLPTTPPAFEKVWWRAVLVAGRQPVAGQEPTLWFETGKFTGSGGCNQIGGLFAIAGNRITITELGGTAIGCPAPIGEIEGAFMMSSAGPSRSGPTDRTSSSAVRRGRSCCGGTRTAPEPGRDPNARSEW